MRDVLKKYIWKLIGNTKKRKENQNNRLIETWTFSLFSLVKLVLLLNLLYYDRETLHWKVWKKNRKRDGFNVYSQLLKVKSIINGGNKGFLLKT